MPALFAFAGTIRQSSYAGLSLSIFLSQYLAVFAALRVQGQPLDFGGWVPQFARRYAVGEPLHLEGWFFIAPTRALVANGSTLTLLLGLVYLMLAAWALAALAYRRAVDVDISAWIAAWAIVPIVQFPVIAALCLLPSRPAPTVVPAIATGKAAVSVGAAAAQGCLAGAGLTLLAVAMGALAFGAYGYGMFVASPFLVGATSAYFANRKQDIGGAATHRLVAGTCALGGIALIAVALEGIVCIFMAAPLGIGAALVGGLCGRAIASMPRGSPAQTLSGLSLLPVVFALEMILPPSVDFDTQERIDVNAPPEAVWQAILHMDAIEAPPALLFRLGVAYPVRGEVIGAGLGGERRGEFSTGTAIERVTDWVPNRKLAFVVLSDVPAMQELSPYAHVHSPHVLGYFRTLYTSFELEPAPDGNATRIIERTSHEIRLDPVLYWLPMARWVVHQNNARVLDHVRRQAERTTPPDRRRPSN